MPVIRDVGYYIRGRRKVWFTSNEDLNSYITGTLIKGKGSLWCKALALPSGPDTHRMQPNNESDMDNSESELSFCESKQKKKTASEEKRSHIQDIFTEQCKNQDSMYSGHSIIYGLKQ